jgi:hypothetical protein
MSDGQLGDRITGRHGGGRLHRGAQNDRIDEMLEEGTHTLQEFIDEMDRLGATNPPQRVLTHLMHLTDHHGDFVPHGLRIERVASDGTVRLVRHDEVSQIGNNEILRA